MNIENRMFDSGGSLLPLYRFKCLRRMEKVTEKGHLWWKTVDADYQLIYEYDDGSSYIRSCKTPESRDAAYEFVFKQLNAAGLIFTPNETEVTTSDNKKEENLSQT